MTSEEKLELALSKGAIVDKLTATIVFGPDGFHDYTSAIEEKYQAQIATAVQLLKDAAEPGATQEKADVAMCAQWDVDALAFIADNQATSDAFIEEVKAKERASCATKLWSMLMDWCKSNRSNPANHNDLFSMAAELRNQDKKPCTCDGRCDGFCLKQERWPA